MWVLCCVGGEAPIRRRKQMKAHYPDDQSQGQAAPRVTDHHH